MSYDIDIATHAEPGRRDIQKALGERVEILGEFVRRGSIVARTKRWEFTIDGPHATDPEDLPEPLAAAVMAPRWSLQIQVPYGAPKTARSLALKAARSLATSCSGAVFDPQEDRVVFPRARRRAAPARSAQERTRRLEIEWCCRPQDLTESGESFLRLVRVHVPEATPMRFGTYEPMQYRYSEDSREFIDFWRASSSGRDFFWSCRRPFDGGGASWPYANPTAHGPGSIPAASLSVSLDGEALLHDLKWRQALRGFFEAVAVETRAFFARAVQSQPQPKTITAEEFLRTGWPSAAGSRWLGLPRHPAWLTWLGRSYADAIKLGEDTLRGCSRAETGALLEQPEDLEAPQKLIEEIPEALFRSQPRRLPDDRLEHLGSPTVIELAREIPSSLLKELR
ncbi:MAG: hypothetical protein ACYS26_04950 [Planctomycetota bacterium]|jgi:hypothetical protein